MRLWPKAPVREAFMKTWIMIAAMAAAMLGTTPTQAAISTSLAKLCREMMVKEYPLTRYGTAISATAQRAYFQDCINRQGKVDEPAVIEDRHRPQ
jgi:hypothetical protein